ncbi:MAG TPA: FtsX-like permease family protein, partial [Ignavibacteriaceae bacterium]|nr:FtsX-like permease family protein [Ignavibacteriaceae bacterium]
FIKTLDIKLASGRYFSKEYPSDSLAVVLNQKAVQMLDIKDPIGKRLSFSGSNISYQIIGIVKDFNFESLHQSIRPLVLLLNRGQSSYLPIKISSKNISESVAFIKNEWKRFVPNKPFEYFFLDDEFSKLYLSEQKTSEIFTAFSVLAIFIASLGLFGLAAFTAERRTKEIGIRKALGASISNIILLLSKEFTKWVLIANVIAWPVAYYFMNNWLKDFAYRIHISLWTFILAGCLALIIALLTVTLHAIKAAMANPIKSLRYE